MNSLGLDRTDEYMLVTELRQQCKMISPHISAKTASDYMAKYRVMVFTGRLPEHAQCRRTYFAWRAALLYGTAVSVRNALRARDSAKYGTLEWHDAVQVLKSAQSIFSRYPPDPAKVHCSSGSSSFTWKDVAKSLPPPRLASKRRMLATLKHILQWREKLFFAVSPKHAAATAILLLTGARPSEIERGIVVEEYNGSLRITILGTKLTSKTGQPTRVLVVAADSPYAQFLIRQAAGVKLTVQGNAKAICDAVQKAGGRAFPQVKEKVSPYTCRHAFASDLKAANVTPALIAQCLGHQADGSQEHYGLSIHGTGNTPILEVGASIQVRTTHRDPALIRSHSIKLHARPTF